jgi:hypothetical protein
VSRSLRECRGVSEWSRKGKKRRKEEAPLVERGRIRRRDRTRSRQRELGAASEGAAAEKPRPHEQTSPRAHEFTNS